MANQHRIETDDDTSGTGAKYTLSHVDRSIEFMQTYCTEQDIFTDRLQDMEDILCCTGLTNEYDFLIQTRDFYARTYERLEKELSNVRRYARHHFNARYQIDQDLYGAAMEANLTFLLEILKQDRQDFIRRLRRRGLPEYLKKTRRN